MHVSNMLNTKTISASICIYFRQPIKLERHEDIEERKQTISENVKMILKHTHAHKTFSLKTPQNGGSNFGSF